MAPFNASLLTDQFTNSLQVTFLIEFQGFEFDPTVAFPFAPTVPACEMSGSDCHSYIIPSPLNALQVIPTNRSIAADEKVNITATYANDGNSVANIPSQYNETQRRGATTYVAVNERAYQLEFFPPESEVVFLDSDCIIIGSAVSGALKTCLKNVGDDLVAGEQSLRCR